MNKTLSRLLPALGLAFALLSLGGCTDSCVFAFDGVCDEGGLFAACAAGTDSTDCRGGTTSCSDTCEFAGDGECDDAGPGADTSFCDPGTDCTDCGPR